MVLLQGDDNPNYISAFSLGLSDDQIYGWGGNDNLDGYLGNDGLDGGSGDDKLYGWDGNDFLTGGEGNDELNGWNGNDLLRGSNGNDFIDGGKDYDIALYSGRSTDYGVSFTTFGNVQVTGSEGTDTLVSIERIYFDGDGGFYDVHTGDSSNNTLTADPNIWSLLWGGDGNDTLTGSNLKDTLTGGNGNDTLIGGKGYDVATYFGQSTAYKVGFTNSGKIRLTGSEGTDVLSGIERIYFNSDGGFYDVHVGDGTDNTLTADPNVWSLLWGDDGNDTLTGGNGNDLLAGSNGDDTLVGGNGNDTLIGGNDNDVLYGDVGADKFRFEFQSEGIDLIKDFNRSEGDKIEIIKSSFGATSLSQFSYDSTTGALFFDASSTDKIGPIQLATLANKPTGFSVQTNVVLV
jgi:Ca2+-binding RTX toxin-like protein